MNPRLFRLLLFATAVCGAAAFGIGLHSSAHRLQELDPSEPLVLHNNRGTAFMEQLNFENAHEQFQKMLAVDPEFAPAHVNIGIALFNLQRYDEAQESFQRALELSPGQINALFMLGLIHRNRDEIDQARQAFTQVFQQDQDDPATNYYLGLLYSRVRDYENAIESLTRVIRREPYNASAHYNLAIAFLRSDRREEGEQGMEEFRRLQGRFGTTTVGLQYLEQGRYSAVIDNLEPFLPPVVDPSGVREIQVRFTDVAQAHGLDFQDGGPGRADLTVQNLDDLERRIVPYVGSGVAVADYDGDGWLDVYLANAGGGRGALFRNRRDGTFKEVTLDAGLDYSGQTMTALWGDYDNDGHLDLYLINYGTNVLYRNNGDGTFTDVTAETGTADAGWGVGGLWVDYDHDGDLDLLITNFVSTDSLPPGPASFPKDFEGAGNVLLRNNGNGTFTDVSRESGLDGGALQTLSVVATDFDNSRDIDFYFVNLNGPNQLFSNLRDGTFEDLADPAGLADVASGIGVGIGDFNQNGWMDFVLPSLEGSASLKAVNLGNQRFESSRILEDFLPSGVGEILHARFWDFDNDGDLDLLLVAAPLFGQNERKEDGTLILLENRGGSFVDATARTGLDRYKGHPFRGVAIADFDNDGDLDLLLTVNGGAPLLLRNDGGNRNHWVQVVPQGTNSNRPGVGTKVEIKSGRLWQKTEISGGSGFMSQSPPLAHFGLGDRTEVDIVRLLWPGGVLQSELEQPVNQRVVIQELDRKGTSCPILYVWDGTTFRFQTDFLGGSAYGYLLAPGVYNFPDADEYILLDREAVALRNGNVVVSMNNQLEEVILFDQVELVVVDHPQEYEVVPDEKLLPGPPFDDFRLIAVSNARPPLAAWDGAGRDLLPALTSVDRIYADLVRPLPFKGYAETHEMILDLGPVDPRRVILLMHAWIDYADSSSNLAASQAGHSLIPPYLQVQDEKGNWVTVLERMGFPAGLPKTMTVDLSGLFLSESRKVRIVTNMRIYWDQVLVETGPARNDYRKKRLPPAKAELSFYGFPDFYSPDGRQPKIYDYDRVSLDGGWKSHVGGYTRFGDVRELLLEKNNRFVITRAGDQVEVEFDVSQLPPIAEGWARSYLLYVVGFGKDMDPNSASPDNIGPLPFHGMSAFPYPETEAFPDREGLVRYLEEWNTRTVDRWYSDLRMNRR